MVVGNVRSLFKAMLRNMGSCILPLLLTQSAVVIVRSKFKLRPTVVYFFAMVLMVVTAFGDCHVQWSQEVARISLLATTMPQRINFAQFEASAPCSPVTYSPHCDNMHVNGVGRLNY
ncbi:hypothetical protein HZ326_7522 [Fusarium oxysporum f. sp. albedinis]|nr:hypothetical protein HZ326_7522 [Fusarium oxysporum f. sp. albedinis]